MADVDDRKGLIAKLFGAAGKEAKDHVLDGYLAALAHMGTEKLARTVASILDGIANMVSPSEFRVPTAGAVWEASRKVRAPAKPEPLEFTAFEPKFLPFDQNANTLLMAYLWDKHAPKGVTRYHVPGALQWLVKYKTAWAHDMRDDRAHGGKLDGKLHWTDCMSRAEAEIDKLIALDKAAA